MVYAILGFNIALCARRIDAVWMSGSVVAFAYEVKTQNIGLDVVTTRKDTKKLYFLNAQKRFIVNVSPVSGKAYFHKPSDSGLID